MTATRVRAQEDLGVLRFRRQKPVVSVVPIPTKTEKVVVQYRPKLAITCVLPPVELTTSFLIRGRYRGKKVYKHVNIKSPTLMMQGTLGAPPKPGRGTPHGFHLWALNTDRDDVIQLKTYKLGNVHAGGSICFGRVNPPRDLKQAFNFYWASGFNTDLSGEYLDSHYKVCPNVVHHRRNCTNCPPCDGSKKIHKCSCSRKIFHKHLGCGCTTVAASNKCKGRCQQGKPVEQIRHCECCKAYQDHWLKVDLGQRKKRDEVTSCGCTYRHKRGCACGKNQCDCPCTCECCTGACSCNKECSCECCTGRCRCQCNCSTHTKFAYFMKIYNEEILPKQAWRPGNGSVIGEKCWAIPTGADAILVSDEQVLLNKIPDKYWRRDNNGNPVIIAAANKLKDGTGWCFETKTFKFTLPNKSVTTCSAINE